MELAGTDGEGLPEPWRRGDVERLALYQAVREPMRQRARHGIQSITATRPDPHDVEDVVYKAFLELERLDPSGVVSMVGLARMIAYRRGQDTGRKIIHQREQMHGMVISLVVTGDQQVQSDGVRAEAEDEVLVGLALDCLDALTEEQRAVVRATILGDENLSDWALRADKSHQAASRQRTRAVEALRRCLRSKGIAIRGRRDQ